MRAVGKGPDIASPPGSLRAMVVRGGAGVGRMESLETLGVAEFKQKLLNLTIYLHDTRASGREHQVSFPSLHPETVYTKRGGW